MDPRFCLCEQFYCYIASHAWCGGVLACSATHWLKAIWVVSRLGLSPIELLWTFMYRFSREHQFSFPWDPRPGLQLLNYTVSACWVFKETAKLSSRAAAQLPFPGSEQSRFSASSPACGVGTNVYFNPDRHIVITHGFTLRSLMAGDVDIFSWAYFTIGTSFTAKCLFMFDHSRIGLFLLLLLSVESSLPILDTWVCGLQRFSPSR